MVNFSYAGNFSHGFLTKNTFMKITKSRPNQNHHVLILHTSQTLLLASLANFRINFRSVNSEVSIEFPYENNSEQIVSFFNSERMELKIQRLFTTQHLRIQKNTAQKGCCGLLNVVISLKGKPRQFSLGFYPNSRQMHRLWPQKSEK